MNLGDFLYLNRIYGMEGHSNQIPEQVKVLHDLSSNPSIKNILEIGFNAGHSSDNFLSSNHDAHVTSFDLGVQHCVVFGKRYIDEKYPYRHTLILGDSRKTVPEFIDKNPDKKFDIIFIDGGHTYDVAKKDIINCKKLAHQNTILIMDDVLYDGEMEYTVDVTKAWREAISWNIVLETEHYDLNKTRGFSIGKYIF